MLDRLQRQLFNHADQLPVTSNGAKYAPLAASGNGHRRQKSISSFNARKIAWLGCAGFFLLLILLSAGGGHVAGLADWHNTGAGFSGSGFVPFGKSTWRDGREFFWWEQFPLLTGYYRGRKDLVSAEDYIPEQRQQAAPFVPSPKNLTTLYHAQDNPDEELLADGLLQCAVTPSQVIAYHGVPQGMPAPLLGSFDVMGIDSKICYDRVNRFDAYGLNMAKRLGGLAETPRGDSSGEHAAGNYNFKKIRWATVQDACVTKNAGALAKLPRTAFVVRTWHTFDYKPYHILMLRALINELSLRSGGQVYVHFLIHVQDETIPIWASQKVYDDTLRKALPAEFAGMGTLWSVAQMRLLYPGPLNETIENFSGGDVYAAYRSLHFPLQYFASEHDQFDFFWQWEMDMRVTGHYGELIDKVSAWADKQSRDHLWERSARYFIPALHDNSYEQFTESVKRQVAEAGQNQVTGQQLPKNQLLRIPKQPPTTEGKEYADLITFSPLFDPEHTAWAFHNDITGYPPTERPPTRAALITASRMSRRLLLLMHQETYERRRTMFPEMFPASIALHYGLKAVYAPIPIYFDRDWPAEHADEVFNNAKINNPESFTAGMDHGNGHFHGEGGSVFGPGEHVFRGATWYSNALFAQELWRRWLANSGREEDVQWELGEGNGRMCLPMMVLHPVKDDAGTPT